jgi:hypothetical protein
MTKSEKVSALKQKLANAEETISAMRGRIQTLENHNRQLVEHNDILEKANHNLQDKIKEMLSDLRE